MSMLKKLGQLSALLLLASVSYPVAASADVHQDGIKVSISGTIINSGREANVNVRLYCTARNGLAETFSTLTNEQNEFHFSIDLDSATTEGVDPQLPIPPAWTHCGLGIEYGVTGTDEIYKYGGAFHDFDIEADGTLTCHDDWDSACASGKFDFTRL